VLLPSRLLACTHIHFPCYWRCTIRWGCISCTPWCQTAQAWSWAWSCLRACTPGAPGQLSTLSSRAYCKAPNTLPGRNPSRRRAQALKQRAWLAFVTDNCNPQVNCCTPQPADAQRGAQLGREAGQADLRQRGQTGEALSSTLLRLTRSPELQTPEKRLAVDCPCSLPCPLMLLAQRCLLNSTITY